MTGSNTSIEQLLQPIAGHHPAGFDQAFRTTDFSTKPTDLVTAIKTRAKHPQWITTYASGLWTDKSPVSLCTSLELVVKSFERYWVPYFPDLAVQHSTRAWDAYVPPNAARFLGNILELFTMAIAREIDKCDFSLHSDTVLDRLHDLVETFCGLSRQVFGKLPAESIAFRNAVDAVRYRARVRFHQLVPTAKVTRSDLAAETRSIAITDLSVINHNPEMIWKTGDVLLGIFQVHSLLGQGGMGQVYHVHHLGWNIDMALKTPRPDVLATQSGIENFLREIDTWSAIPMHPNVAGCYFVRVIDHIPRVFAEYAPGGDLNEAIESGRLYQGTVSEVLMRVLDISIQMAWGLDHAHRHQVVHQDVKPHNVLLSNQQECKITDFGLAGAFHGMTPAYCSIEQANEGEISYQTDVWSWALTVLHMMIGERAWLVGSAGRHILESIDIDQAFPISGLGLPLSLKRILESCLLEDPKERPRSMSVIANKVIEVYQEIVGSEYPRITPREEYWSADGWNNRAVSLLEQARWDEARECLKKALRTRPLHPEAVYNRSLLDLKQGDCTREKFYQDVLQATETRPDENSASLVVWGLYSYGKDRYGTDRSLYRPTIPMRPDTRAAVLDATKRNLDGVESLTWMLSRPKSANETVRYYLATDRAKAELIESQNNQDWESFARAYEQSRKLEGFNRTPTVQQLVNVASKHLVHGTLKDHWLCDVVNTRLPSLDCICVNDNGDWMAWSSKNQIEIYQREAGTSRFLTLPQSTSEETTISALFLTSDGRDLLVGCANGLVYWVQTDQVRIRARWNLGSSVYSFAYNSVLGTMTAVTADSVNGLRSRVVWWWSAVEDSVPKSSTLLDCRSAHVFAYNDGFIASSLPARLYVLREVEGQQKLVCSRQLLIREHMMLQQAIATQCGKVVVSAGYDGEMIRCDMAVARVTDVKKGTGGPIAKVCASEVGDVAVVRYVSESKPIGVWSINPLQEITRLVEDGKWCRDYAVAGNGRLLVLSGVDGVVRTMVLDWELVAQKTREDVCSVQWLQTPASIAAHDQHGHLDPSWPQRCLVITDEDGQQSIVPIKISRIRVSSRGETCHDVEITLPRAQDVYSLEFAITEHNVSMKLGRMFSPVWYKGQDLTQRTGKERLERVTIEYGEKIQMLGYTIQVRAN